MHFLQHFFARKLARVRKKLYLCTVNHVAVSDMDTSTNRRGSAVHFFIRK